MCAAPKKMLKPLHGSRIIESIPFGERPGAKPYNASEIVPIDDSRFLFCDNNIGNTLFELRLNAQGTMRCRLIDHPINGIGPGTIDDMECMTVAEGKNNRFILIAPSMSLVKKKKGARKKRKRGKESPSRSGLLRITLTENDRLEGEVVPDFRYWLIDHSLEIGKSFRHLPDDHGLNIEGLAWDPAKKALLFGVRTPTMDGKPLIIRVHVKNISGIWNLSNFEILPPVVLDTDDIGIEQGIRSMDYDSSREAFLVVVGNAASLPKAPFMLYSWDGNARGSVQRFTGVEFDPKMKVEGVTHGTIEGRGTIIFVDDAGGYQVLWDDDPRLVLF
jgi:hypothetical protein